VVVDILTSKINELTPAKVRMPRLRLIGRNDHFARTVPTRADPCLGR
jgi:hypothetical protein